jgi:hypothetical protein
MIKFVRALESIKVLGAFIFSFENNFLNSYITWKDQKDYLNKRRRATESIDCFCELFYA